MSEVSATHQLNGHVRGLLRLRVPLLALVAFNAVFVARVPLAKSPRERSLRTSGALSAGLIQSAGGGKGAAKLGPSDEPDSIAESSAAVAAVPGDMGRVDNAVAVSTGEPARAAAVSASEAAALSFPGGEVRGAVLTTVSLLGRSSHAIAASLAEVPHRYLVAYRRVVGSTLPRDPISTESQTEGATMDATLPAAPVLGLMPADEASKLHVVNPESTGGAVSFLVDGEVITLRPGESYERTRGGSWHIVFHRGGEYGEAEFALQPGAYQFRVTRDGWNLVPAGN